MAEVIICDLCGERIPIYNGLYRFKYGVVSRRMHLGDYKELSVCEDCIKQLIEMRKAAQAWKEQ